MNDPLNEIMLEIVEYANANGSFGPQELREHADAIAKNVGKARIQREMLVYWLLQAYRALTRESWESGMTRNEATDALCSLLANLGYDPNLSDAAKELMARPPAYFLERAVAIWSTQTTQP